jgi:hypothetical protein
MESVVTLKNVTVTLHGFKGLKRAKALWMGKDLKLE